MEPKVYGSIEPYIVLMLWDPKGDWVNIQTEVASCELS